MNKQEIIKLLKELKSERGIIGKIEWAIGIPKNNLSGYISGSKEIPQKFIKPLSDYLENGEYIHKTIELPRDFIGVEKIAILRADGTMEEITHPSMFPDHVQMWFTAVKELTQELPIGNVLEYPESGNKGIIAAIKERPEVVYKSGNLKIDDIAIAIQDYNKPDNSEIEKQIAAVKAEKIPPERNTTLGKKIWQKEQENRINELKLQIK